MRVVPSGRRCVRAVSQQRQAESASPQLEGYQGEGQESEQWKDMQKVSYNILIKFS